MTNDLPQMTNEEAIERLNHMKMFIGYDAENPIVKEMQSALEMAIKALKREVSREKDNAYRERKWGNK